MCQTLYDKEAQLKEIRDIKQVLQFECCICMLMVILSTVCKLRFFPHT